MLKYAVALKKQQDNFIHAYPPFNILLKLSRSYLQIIMGTIQVLKVQPVLWFATHLDITIQHFI